MKFLDFEHLIIKKYLNFKNIIDLEQKPSHKIKTVFGQTLAAFPLVSYRGGRLHHQLF